VDIAPTLLDFAGVQIPEDMQGRSMKGLLQDDEETKKNWRRSAYYQYFEYPKWHNVQPHYGVRTDRYKLIHFYYNIDEWEFYDMEKDPDEMDNQYGNPEYAEIISELKTEIDNLQKQYNDTVSLDDRRKMTDKYMLKYEE
jgi:arylsulfatase